jgi:hypothetical protein
MWRGCFEFKLLENLFFDLMKTLHLWSFSKQSVVFSKNICDLHLSKILVPFGLVNHDHKLNPRSSKLSNTLGLDIRQTIWHMYVFVGKESKVLQGTQRNVWNTSSFDWKVLPELFRAVRMCEDGGLKEFITWKLGTLVSIVRQVRWSF